MTGCSCGMGGAGGRSPSAMDAASNGRFCIGWGCGKFWYTLRGYLGEEYKICCVYRGERAG